MWSRKRRLLFLPMLAVAMAAGVALEAGLDRFEGQSPDMVVLGLLVGLTALGVSSYWYLRRVRARTLADERTKEIERRASRLSHGVLLLGVALLASVVTFTFIDGIATLGLWVLLAGSIVVHELSIAYYSRQL